MTPRDPLSSTINVRLVARFSLVSIILILLATCLDGQVLHKFYMRGDLSDGNRMFRVMGYLPLWMLIALVFAMVDSAKMPAWTLKGMVGGWYRTILIVLASSVTGAVAEGLKLLIRRERPNLDVSHYTYRAWSEGMFASGPMGMPSSHAAVAFGGALMLCKLFPRATVVWWILAIGCAVTRIGSQKHFLSDTLVSALIGMVVVRCLWNWHRWNRQQDALSAAE